MRETIQIVQTDTQCLVASTRETTNSTMGSIVDRAIVFLHIRHQVIQKILTEEVKLYGTAITLPHQTGWIAIGKYDDHLLGSTLGNQVIQDKVHLANLEIDLFGIGGTADEIHHGVFLPGVFVIRRWCIDYRIAKHTHRIRPVVHVVHLAMRHILQRMDEVSVTTHVKQTVLEALVGEPLCILRVHHLMTIHNETIGINVGNSRAKRYGPYIVFAFLHLMATSKLHINHHLLCMFILIVERYGVVRIHNRRRCRSRTSRLSV